MSAMGPSEWLAAIVEPMEPVATRRPARDWLVALGTAAATGTVFVAALGFRRDLTDLPFAWVAGGAAAWVVTIAAVSFFALVPRRGDVLPRARTAGLLGLGCGALSVAAGWALATSALTSTIIAPGFGSFARSGAPCIATGMVAAIGPVVVSLWALRGAAPLGARWLGAGIGAAGGALGGLVLHLYCPIANATHTGFIHGGIPLLAAATAGALAFLIIDRPRS